MKPSDRSYVRKDIAVTFIIATDPINEGCDVWPCDVWRNGTSVFRFTGLGTWECIK